MDPARSEDIHGAAASGGLPACTCPGCGRPVDPLRAGHVAALEDRGFHYFCRAACKDEYLRVRGRPPEEEVETAAPPQVAEVTDAVVERASPPVALYVPVPDEAPAEPILPSERIVRFAPSHASPARPKALAASVPRPSDRSSNIIDAVGIVAGVLAPSI